MTQIFNADCYFKEEQYNPRIFDRVLAYGHYITLQDIYDSIRDNTFLNI